MTTITAMPSYESAELAALTEQQLLDLMVRDEDRVPRNVIDECAQRGDAMVTALRTLIADEVDWHEENEVLGKWWLRAHAIMILGLMASDAAGELLIAYLRRIDYECDDNLQDWFAGYWPILFANKSSQCIDPLKEFAEDDKRDRWLRHEAGDARVYWFRKRGGQALEDALDWLAGFVTDDKNEMDLRMITGNLLLEYPRERFRVMLETLADEQDGWSRIYDKGDVEWAFQQGTDHPKREPFNNPWLFYLPDNIAARQKRWHEEDEAHERRLAAGLLPTNKFNSVFDGIHEFAEPYVRDTPKTGRNDPCPCGSGKKYKKCCLGVEE